jgi:hypothetical protein
MHSKSAVDRPARRRLLGGIASHGGERRQPAVPAWCSADRMRTCAPWSRLVADLPDYDDRLLANSQLMANDQRPYERRLWSLQRVRPGASCIAISRSLLLAWQRYRRPHPRCGANKFSAGSIAVSRTGLGAASGRLDPVGGGSIATATPTRMAATTTASASPCSASAEPNATASAHPTPPTRPSRSTVATRFTLPVLHVAANR